MQKSKGKVNTSLQPEVTGTFTDVFISYARSDEQIASNLAKLLDSEGFDVWFDSKIYAGADWENMLMNILASAKAVVVLWSHRGETTAIVNQLQNSSASIICA